METRAPVLVSRPPTVSAPATGWSGAGAASASQDLIEIDHLDFFYATNQALHDISLRIQEKKVTAFIGPSGCGKSTLLRCLNRMNDLIDGTRVAAGTIKIRGVDIYQPDVDVIELRKRVGMVFQKSNPFPKSIYENITYGLRLQGRRDKADLDAVVEKSLRGAALWTEVKDRLHESGLGLSGGQQQRLCIARAIAVELEMLRDAIGAFINREPDKARAVVPRDSDVDDLNRQLHRELSSYMVERPTTISRCLHLMVISKSLERIADHATNIAEEVVYLYEAKDIRHAGSKNETADPGR